jgi:hypothetical protein
MRKDNGEEWVAAISVGVGVLVFLDVSRPCPRGGVTLAGYCAFGLSTHGLYNHASAADKLAAGIRSVT